MAVVLKVDFLFHSFFVIWGTQVRWFRWKTGALLFSIKCFDLVEIAPFWQWLPAYEKKKNLILFKCSDCMRWGRFCDVCWGPFSREYIGCLAAEFHFLLFSRKAPSKGKETQRRHFYSDRVLRLWGKRGGGGRPWFSPQTTAKGK